MAPSLSSVFHAWAGCFPPHLAGIIVHMILMSAQICIWGTTCAEFLICWRVVSHKEYVSVSAGLSELEYLYMLVARCNDSTGVCYRCFKVVLSRSAAQCIPHRSLRAISAQIRWSDADHEHTYKLYKLLSWSCRCVCFGSRWESVLLSSWTDDFTARLIPFSDVWIKNTEFDFWRLSNLAFLRWQFLFF